MYKKIILTTILLISIMIPLSYAENTLANNLDSYLPEITVSQEVLDLYPTGYFYFLKNNNNSNNGVYQVATYQFNIFYEMSFNSNELQTIQTKYVSFDLRKNLSTGVVEMWNVNTSSYIVVPDTFEFVLSNLQNNIPGWQGIYSTKYPNSHAQFVYNNFDLSPIVYTTHPADGLDNAAVEPIVLAKAELLGQANDANLYFYNFRLSTSDPEVFDDYIVTHTRPLKNTEIKGLFGKTYFVLIDYTYSNFTAMFTSEEDYKTKLNVYKWNSSTQVYDYTQEKIKDMLFYEGINSATFDGKYGFAFEFDKSVYTGTVLAPPQDIIEVETVEAIDKEINDKFVEDVLNNPFAGQTSISQGSFIDSLGNVQKAAQESGNFLRSTSSIVNMLPSEFSIILTTVITMLLSGFGLITVIALGKMFL